MDTPDIWKNGIQMQFRVHFFSVTTALNWYFFLCLVAESALLNVSSWIQMQLPVDLMSLWLSHELPSRVLLGSWSNCTLSLGPKWFLLPCACSTMAWGTNSSDSAVATWFFFAGILGCTLPNKAGTSSKSCKIIPAACSLHNRKI